MEPTSEDSDKDESEEYDQIPPQQREKARERDNYSCQLCPQKAPKAGGDTPVHVHHKTYDPDDCDLHDLDNLITLCVHCHGWHHSRPTSELPPVTITDEAAANLKPIDFSIIDLLYREGPLSIEEIEEGIRPEKCRPSVEECLWRVMGIDTVVEKQHQLIDQDADSDRWGLPDQIESSKRHLPSTIHGVIQRTIDSLVVEALDRGCDRYTISKVIDIDPRTVNRNKYRGQAYDFPLDRYTGRGRPPKDGFEVTRQSERDASGVPDSQQHLDDLNADENSIDKDSQTATTDGGTVSTDPDVAELRDAQTNEEAARSSGDIKKYETIDPNQPQIDGSNREYLITASEYPDDLRPTIQRLNITRIARREQGQFPGFSHGDTKPNTNNQSP